MLLFQLWVTYLLVVVLPFLLVGTATVESHPRLNDAMARLAPYVVGLLFAGIIGASVWLAWSL